MTNLSKGRSAELQRKKKTILQMFGKGPKAVWAIKELRTIGQELGEIPIEKTIRPMYA